MPEETFESNHIKIVSSDEIDAAKKKASLRLSSGPGDYGNWEELHQSLKSTLLEYGTVSWDPDPLPDFYFSGDWFHENSDGFGLCSPSSIKRELLLKLPKILADHHKHAMLEMNGIEAPMEGLVVFATTTGVLVGWQGLDADSCKSRLREMGIVLALRPG